MVLSRPLRERLRAYLRENSIYCTLLVSPETTVGLGAHAAIAQGVKQVTRKIRKWIIQRKRITEKTLRSYYRFLIDRNRVRNLVDNHQFIIKGESSIRIISAASITARVHPHKYMPHMARSFPQYVFERYVD